MAQRGRSILVSPVLCAWCFVVATAGCLGSDEAPSGQTHSDIGGSDAVEDLVDAGEDSPVTDTGDDGNGDWSGEDVPPDDPIQCGDNEHVEGDQCVCDPGYVESGEGRCVLCTDNSQCGGRVCAGNTCRDCLYHEECGTDLYCGDDGRCTTTPPACTGEGDRRCNNHGVQYCSDETWVDDTSSECPYGCNDDTEACYPDTNVGWIGGRCGTASDCTRMDSIAAVCLPDAEGFFEGTCSQRCVGLCPDQSQATDTVTFCVDSEGLNDAGTCVSRCDYDLFSDSGCRPGYECRQMPRYANPAVVQTVCLPLNWYRNPSRQFDYGVTSGEITASSAIVWAHTGSVDTAVTVVYGTAPDALFQQTEGESTSETGFTVQIDLTDLTSNTDYYYRVDLDGLAESPVGHFHTAVASGVSAPVRFMFSADVDQAKPSLNGIFEEMSSFDVDFFVNLGDWPIGDSAATVADYRAIHAKGREDWRIREFLQENASYSIFDDHEVYDNWDAAYRAAHPQKVEDGLMVWSQWWPLRRIEAGEFYRRFRWGDLELFILDCRTHRDAETEPDGSAKTMLGVAQREWLLDALAASDAVFKIVVTSVPLDFGTTGADSWMGYRWERDLILDTITAEDIGGVVFLAGDQHWFSAHHLNSGFKEFMSCPLTRHLRQPPSPQDEHIASELVDYNFSVMTYDPDDGGTLLLEAFDDQGTLFYSELVRSGRGRIEVGADVAAPFTICPRDEVGPDCTHIFTGIAPATFEYAVPGPYRIFWEPASGFPAPESQAGVLADGQTLRFEAEYGDIALPFVDTFDTDRGWIAVDDGDLEGPSSWVLTTDGTSNNVLEQRSNIYSGSPDGEGAIDKLGTLAYTGDPDWTDYDFSLRFRTGDNDSVGVIARYLDNDNYYRFSLDQQRSFARLVARVGGTFYLLDSDSNYAGYSLSTWTWIRLVVDGGTIEAYVSDDGSTWDLLLSASDSRVGRGAVGLYCWGAQGVEFDDVEVLGLD